jgi:hypothetical protein
MNLDWVLRMKACALRLPSGRGTREPATAQRANGGVPVLGPVLLNVRGRSWATFPASTIAAVAGGVLVLFIYGLVTKGRA